MVPAALLSAESEASVLAGLLRDNNRIDRVADVLAADDFGEEVYGRIYSAMLDLNARGKPANPPVLASIFSGDSGFEDAGGVKFLVEATSSMVALLDPYGMAKHVRELAVRRRLLAEMQAAAEALTNVQMPVDQIISGHDTILTAAIERTEPNTFKGGVECVDEVIASFNRKIIGVSSGGAVQAIDRLIGKVRPGWFGVVAGRPGMGKTAALISYLRGAASLGHHTLFASLEMKWEVLSMRLVADVCHSRGTPVPFDAIIGGTTSQDQQRTICRARDDIAAMAFKIIDKRCHTLGQLRRAIRRRKRELAAIGEKLELVIVDYLQLLMPDGKAKSEYEAVSEVSRELKIMAGDEDVAIIAMSQLSRAVDGRPDHRPHLPDLRSSGQIEQDADFVVFLLSEEYYIRNEEPEPDTAEHHAWSEKLNRSADVLEFICAKHRHGRVGNLFGRFYRDYQAVR